MVRVAGLGISNGLLAIGQAYYLAGVIDMVFLGGQELAAVAGSLWLLAGLACVRALLTYLEGVLAFELAARVKTDLRERLTRHLFSLGPVALANQPAGELLTVMSEGIENLEAYFAKYLPQLCKACCIPVLILAVVWPLDRATAAIMLVTAPLIPVFMVLIGKAAERMNHRQWETLNKLSAHFLDVLAGLTTLKLFGRSREQIAIITRISREFRDATMDVLRVAFLSALALELLATISTALVAVALGLRLLYGEVAFMQAFFLLLLAPEYYLPLRLLGSQFHAGMAGKTAAADIVRLLSLTGGERVPGTERLLSPQQVSLAFNRVHAAYQAGSRPALRGISFTLAAGRHLAIVGPSGAGKSTVAALLLGFITPAAGSILVNGQDLATLRSSEWLRHVAYVPQRPHLFQGTVADNIRLARPDAPMAAVMQAGKAAGAHEFISRLPNGYDTLVGAGGRGLSGGECQRLSIARAFLQDAPLLILDEAARGLDVSAQARLDNTLARLLQGRTAIIIAHRLSTVRQADQILVLAEGRLAEIGPPAELIKRQGVYSRLLAAQAGEGQHV
ncbi:ATP-binding/permease protein CydD [Sporomusa termitida]|uniref:ATP-binding/permease protein CydD n=1 Tax=Sporomusa termitida TaxID=2377 RepID=A0A517E0U9_9FIRM|nr:ATP-binding/permease protein CydD [Sporomusa termitida]